MYTSGTTAAPVSSWLLYHRLGPDTWIHRIQAVPVGPWSSEDTYIVHVSCRSMTCEITICCDQWCLYWSDIALNFWLTQWLNYWSNLLQVARSLWALISIGDVWHSYCDIMMGTVSVSWAPETNTNTNKTTFYKNNNTRIYSPIKESVRDYSPLRETPREYFECLEDSECHDELFLLPEQVLDMDSYAVREDLSAIVPSFREDERYHFVD